MEHLTPLRRRPPSPLAARLTVPMLAVAVMLCAVGCPSPTTGNEPEAEPEREPEPSIPPCEGHDGGDGACVDEGTCSDGFTLLRSGRCAGWIHIGELEPPRTAALVTYIGDSKFAVTGGFAQNALGDDIALTDITVVDVQTREVRNYFFDSDARTYHSGALLDDGRLLLVGGNSAAYSADVFSVADGSLTGVTSNGIGRNQHKTARLQDGRVLHYGGVSTGDNDSIFDATDDSWTQVTGIGDTGGLAGAGVLPDGRPFHIGGWTLDKADYIPDDRLFVFDLATERWTETATLPVGVVNVSSAATASGKIIAACGSSIDAENVVSLPRGIFVNTAPDDNPTFSATLQMEFGRSSCGLHSLGGEEVVLIGQSQSDDEGFPTVTAPVTQVYDADTQSLTAIPGPVDDDTTMRTGADRSFAFVPGVGGLFAGGGVGILGINGYVYERTGSIDLLMVGQ